MNIQKTIKEINDCMRICSILEEEGSKNSSEYTKFISKAWSYLTSETFENYYISKAFYRMSANNSDDILADEVRNIFFKINSEFFDDNNSNDSNNDDNNNDDGNNNDSNSDDSSRYKYNRVASSGRGKGGYIKKENGQYFLYSAFPSRANANKITDKCFLKADFSHYPENTYLYKFREKIENADRKNPFFIKICYSEDKNGNVSEIKDYKDYDEKNYKEGFFLSDGLAVDKAGHKTNRLNCYVIPKISSKICALNKEFAEKSISKKFLDALEDNEYIAVFYYKVRDEIKGVSFFSVVEFEPVIIHTDYITFMETKFNYIISDLIKKRKGIDTISIDIPEDNSSEDPKNTIQIPDSNVDIELDFLKKSADVILANTLLFIKNELKIKKDSDFDILNKFYSTETERCFLEIPAIAVLPELKRHEKEMMSFIDIKFLNFIMIKKCVNFKSMCLNDTKKYKGNRLDFPIKPIIYLKYYENKQPDAEISKKKDKNKYISDKKHKFVRTLENAKTNNELVKNCLKKFINDFMDIEEPKE